MVCSSSSVKNMALLSPSIGFFLFQCVFGSYILISAYQQQDRGRNDSEWPLHTCSVGDRNGAWRQHFSRRLLHWWVSDFLRTFSGVLTIHLALRDHHTRKARTDVDLGMSPMPISE